MKEEKEATKKPEVDLLKLMSDVKKAQQGSILEITLKDEFVLSQEPSQKEIIAVYTGIPRVPETFRGKLKNHYAEVGMIAVEDLRGYTCYLTPIEIKSYKIKTGL